jgi:hypothetical protein
MGHRNRVLVAGALILIGLAVACSSTAIPLAQESTSAPAPGQPTPALTILASPTPKHEEEVAVPKTPAVSTPASAGLDSLVIQAREDLAQRLAIDEDQIELVEASEVVWPDGALGCPQPGMAYIQVLQAGALIRLAAGGRTYHYHSGGGRDPFLCEQTAAQPPSQDAPSSPPPPAPGTPQARRTGQPSLTVVPLQPGETVTVSKPAGPTPPAPVDRWLAGIVQDAKVDLALRLSIDEEQIELVEAKGVLWPEGGLGWPQPGLAYIQVQRDGAFVRLRVAKRTYNYHSGYPGPPFLCEHPDTEFIP